jgi:hypothetical protein
MVDEHWCFDGESVHCLRGDRDCDCQRWDSYYYAIPAIFSVVAAANPNPKPSGNTVDRWTYPNNSPTCGQVGGKWQSPQEVAPAGVGAFSATINQLVCSP